MCKCDSVAGVACAAVVVGGGVVVVGGGGVAVRGVAVTVSERVHSSRKETRARKEYTRKESRVAERQAALSILSELGDRSTAQHSSRKTARRTKSEQRRCIEQWRRMQPLASDSPTHLWG